MASPNSTKKRKRPTRTNRRYADPPALPRRNGNVCVIEGYGVRVHVKRGHLVAEDGYGTHRRKRVFSRAMHGLSRFLILGHEGFITLEAIRWLSDLGIPYQHIDRDGRILFISVPGAEDARLRRAQAMALGNSTGVELARMLLREKLTGQRANLRQLIREDASEANDLAAAFDAATKSLEVAETLNELLLAERDGAIVYWSAWAPVVTRFRGSDAPRVPAHWHRLGQRGSPLTSAPRSAVTPANALLNYLYAILEAETRIACLTVGLDPSLGILHADYRSRDSLALDIMEAIRPQVDTYVLELLQRRTFRATEFHETRRGVCRVVPPLTHALSETGPRWGELVGPIVEQVVRMLAEAPGSHISRLATPLTNANRHEGRTNMRKRPQRARKPEPAKVARRCHRCGGELPHARRVYCDDCLPHFQREQLERAGVAPSPVDVLRRRQGGDPTHGGQAAVKRGSATAKRKREVAECEKQHGQLVDLSAFEREILPLIGGVSLSRLVRATGLSLRYCSQIRRGEKVPHPRHWQALTSARVDPANVGPSMAEGSPSRE
jgi:CRISPR-associated endonuclease Cas1